MKYIINIIILLLFFIFTAMSKTSEFPQKKMKYSIVIHGGAGGIRKGKLTEQQEKDYKNTLASALKTGEKLLKQDSSAVFVVQEVIKILEDSPLFNAGKGAVFNNLGFNEMDASIMDGSNLNCGALAGITNLKNPIEGAKIVMEKSKHIFLYGDRGQEFCIKNGATYADSSYFFTKKRHKQYLRAIKRDKVELDHGEIEDGSNEIKKFGTVGCVVLDTKGNLAAGTSTGGLTNKKFGRIGDSPIIGAGTYADNKTCAVSCTGRGEYFIRGTIARDVSALMEYKNYSLKKAGKKAIEKLNTIDGRGGIIAVDKKGNYIMLFNTQGMYRGIANSEGFFCVEMYGK